MTPANPHSTAREDGSCDDCGSFHGNDPLVVARQTNARLNRRIGQLESKLARQDRIVKAAVKMQDYCLSRWRDERDYHKRLRRENSRMKHSFWAWLRVRLGLSTDPPSARA